MTRRGSSRFRSLPLFWKLLVPFLGLMLITGAAGTFLVVRDLSERGQAALDQELAGRSLDARTALHDRELYLLESVNFASNLKGMAEAIRTREDQAIEGLLRSVLALKRDLDVLMIADTDGSTIVRLPDQATGSPDPAMVASASRQASGRRVSGIIRSGDRAMLAVAGPVCFRTDPCAPAGVAIAAMAMESLALEALARTTTSSVAGPPEVSGLTIFDGSGGILASAGELAQPPAPVAPGIDRTIHRSGSTDIATLYVPFEIQGRRAGTVAVSMPRAPAFAAVRGAGLRVALIVLAAMAGIVALGALLSRSILRQVRPLVSTSRALGQGDLTARVPVESDDELGELAHGVNQMAEQLQASYETLELRVAQRTAEVQRLLQERTEFFAAMSHEFRTPLAVVLSEADMLMEPKVPVTAHTAKEAGSTLRASGEQLLHVINEILDLAKSDAGRVEVDLRSVGLSDVVRDLGPTMEGLAKAGDLSLAIDVPGDLPPVMADTGRLREIILNLVDNAVKYTPAGGTVAVTAARHNGSVHLAVADSGVGIPTGVGERIFEPFYRVKGTKPFRGQASSGLGLALAKRFAEAQGGGIAFSSSPKGSTFTVTLKPAPARSSRKRPARARPTRAAR